MSDTSRRKFITAGLAVAAGASGIAVAAKVARHHGLIRRMGEDFTVPEKR
jgi:hypothetical protein